MSMEQAQKTRIRKKTQVSAARSKLGANDSEVQVHLPGSDIELLGSKVDLIGSKVNLIGSESYLSLSLSCKVNLIGSKVDLIGSRSRSDLIAVKVNLIAVKVDLIGSRSDLVGSARNLIGSARNLIGIGSNLMRSKFDIVGRTAELRKKIFKNASNVKGHRDNMTITQMPVAKIERLIMIVQYYTNCTHRPPTPKRVDAGDDSQCYFYFCGR